MYTIEVKIKAYLRALKKTTDRAAVPSVEDLATACGVSRVAMSKFINGQRDAVNLALLNCVVAELYKRGFTPQLDDLFTMTPTPATEQ